MDDLIRRIYGTVDYYISLSFISFCITCSSSLPRWSLSLFQVQAGRTHVETFYDCGRDTVTGAAELAQIPSDWK